MSDSIICHKQEKSWTITLNRSDRANQLNVETLQTLKGHFVAAAHAPNLRALILTGEGERVFCSGADMSEAERQLVIQNQLWNEIGDALNALPLLTIALINGHCIGRAMTLLLGCDIRISVSQAKFSYPSLQTGTSPSAHDVKRLHGLIGPGRTAALLLGGQRIHGQRALDWGLVDYLVERPALANLAKTMSLVAIQADRDQVAEVKRLCREA